MKFIYLISIVSKNDFKVLQKTLLDEEKKFITDEQAGGARLI